MNNYNSVLMKALNCNHNTPDVFGVVTFVTDYYAKDDSGLQGVLTATVKAYTSYDFKNKMRNVAINSSMGKCKAVYKLSTWKYRANWVNGKSRGTSSVSQYEIKLDQLSLAQFASIIQNLHISMIALGSKYICISKG